jgi:hypothetical protein
VVTDISTTNVVSDISTTNVVSDISTGSVETPTCSTGTEELVVSNNGKKLPFCSQIKDSIKFFHKLKTA